MVGILLTINNPIIPKLNKLRKEFLNIDKSNSKKIKIGNKLNPAAAGEGTPTKYMFESIFFGAKYISAVKRANLKAAQTAKNKAILHPKDFKSERDQ